MKTIRIPAEIILTFPPQVMVDDAIINAATFACEQHLNTIGIINYNGPMLQTGALSFGLRVHMADAPSLLKGQVVEMIPEFDLRRNTVKMNAVGLKAEDTESIVTGLHGENLNEPENG